MSGTISFYIKALDESTSIPIPHTKIQLENANLGQEAITNTQGLASFNIQETQYLKPFRAKLINAYYKQCPVSDRSIILNSIRRQDKPFTLRFLGKIWLYFNGNELFLYQGNQVLDYFRAYSGKALSKEEREELKRQYEYESFVSYKDKENNISYFCLDKKWQEQKDKGAIPEGEYYININKSKDNKTKSGIRRYENVWYSKSRNKEGEKQWGKYNVPIYTNKECTNTLESKTQRNNFFIHGGESYGDKGGIDLAKEDSTFFTQLQFLEQQSIFRDLHDELESIKLIVDYTSLCISLESIELERIIEQENNHHKVILNGIYTKSKDMKEEVFNRQ